MASRDTIFEELSRVANLFGLKVSTLQIDGYTEALQDMTDESLRMRMAQYIRTAQASRLPTPGQLRTVELPQRTGTMKPSRILEKWQRIPGGDPWEN